MYNTKNTFNVFILWLIFLSFLYVPDNVTAQTDSTFIGKFSQEFSARIFMTQKFVSMSLENNENLDLEYSANNPMGIGLGFSWKEMGFSLSHGFNSMSDPKKGATKSIDFQYHYYGKKVTFDFFAQNYKGFYLEKGKDDYTLFPNLNFTRYGLFGQYVFNGNKFSYRAAFDQSEKQLRSAGSFLLGGGAYYTKVNFEDSIRFNERMYQIGPSLGYAYTRVIRDKYFVTGSLTPGMSFNFENLKSKINVNPTLFFRFASGYNSDTWSLNLSFIMNRVYVSYTTDHQISLNSGNLQFTFIKRFDSQSKFLKKLPVF